RRERAGEDAHQRALAGAVLADQPADLATRDGQVDTGERGRGAERLADSAHLEPRRGHLARSGWSSALISACSMLSGVATCTPVSIRRSTGCPLMWATIVLTERYPIFTGSCTTRPSSARSCSPLTMFSDESKPTNRTLPAHPLSCRTRRVANVDDS